MLIPQHESEILKNAFCSLHDAYHNVNCLSMYLERAYPKEAEIEYTILLTGLLRMQEIESLLGVVLPYPVFGKEIEMADKNILHTLLKERLGVTKYGYLDYDGDMSSKECVNAELHLFEYTFSL